MTAKKATKRPKLKAVPDEPNKPPPPTKTTKKKLVNKRPSRPDLAARHKVFQPDMSKLQPLDDTEDWLRIVLYGRQKIGKTTSVASLAERGRLVVVDPEGSWKSRALRRRGIDTSQVVLWPEWGYDDLQQMYVTVKDQLEREPGSIFAVVIDTGTALSQFWLEDVVRFELDRPGNKRKDRTVFDVYQDDYGTLAEMFKTLITRQLYQLPCHVVTVCHNRESEDETGSVRVGPALSPAAQLSLMTYSDWILRMETDRHGNRITHAAPTGRYEAGDRHGVLEDKSINKSLLDLLVEWETQ